MGVAGKERSDLPDDEESVDVNHEGASNQKNRPTLQRTSYLLSERNEFAPEEFSRGRIVNTWIAFEETLFPSPGPRGDRLKDTTHIVLCRTWADTSLIPYITAGWVP